MKKLLAIIAAVALISCNDSADGDKNGSDSTNKIDSSYDSKIDSVQNRADSIIDKLDSTKDAKVDKLRDKVDSAKKN